MIFFYNIRLNFLHKKFPKKVNLCSECWNSLSMSYININCVPPLHLNSVTLLDQEEVRRGKTGCINNKFYLQVQRIRNYRCRGGQRAEPSTIIVVLCKEIIWDVIKCFNLVDVIETIRPPASRWKFSDAPFPVCLIGCLLCLVVLTTPELGVSVGLTWVIDKGKEQFPTLIIRLN